MNNEFISGASLLVVGGLILASAITGTTGSLFATFLAPGALQITNPVAGTFRSAGGKEGTSPTDPRGNGPPPVEGKPTASPPQSPTSII